jgi:hypothetical protein
MSFGARSSVKVTQTFRLFFSERRKQQQQPNKNQEKNKRECVAGHVWDESRGAAVQFGGVEEEEENNAYNTRRHSTHNNWMANTFSMWNESSVEQKI